MYLTKHTIGDGEVDAAGQDERPDAIETEDIEYLVRGQLRRRDLNAAVHHLTRRVCGLRILRRWALRPREGIRRPAHWEVFSCSWC